MPLSATVCGTILHLRPNSPALFPAIVLPVPEFPYFSHHAAMVFHKRTPLTASIFDMVRQCFRLSCQKSITLNCIPTDCWKTRLPYCRPIPSPKTWGQATSVRTAPMLSCLPRAHLAHFVGINRAVQYPSNDLPRYAGTGRGCHLIPSPWRSFIQHWREPRVIAPVDGDDHGS